MKLISVKNQKGCSISLKITTFIVVLLMLFVGALYAQTFNVSNTVSGTGWAYSNGALSGNLEANYPEKLKSASFCQTNTHILFIINILVT